MPNIFVCAETIDQRQHQRKLCAASCELLFLFIYLFIYSQQVLVLFRQDYTNLKHVFTDHVAPDLTFEKFCEMCSLAWDANKFGCLVINKECGTNEGRYRVGFDQYIVP